MIHVSFLYPKTEGSRFDLEYYTTRHCALSRSRFGGALKQLVVERGISGVMPGSEAPFHAVARMTFDSADTFYEALMPHLEELKADVANYTDVEAVIQISEPVNV